MLLFSLGGKPDTGLCSVSVIPGFSYQPLKAQRRIKAQKRLFKKEEEIHGAVAK